MAVSTPPWPAVMIGGPPHAGKSTLIYHLTHALRDRRVTHYVLRSAPDGEGDWAYESSPETVRILRIKGKYTQTWVDRMCRDIRSRHLPLLVDVGGWPQDGQEEIFRCCTHAVILSRYDDSRRFWLRLARDARLELIADLHSDLQGQERIDDAGAPLRGVIAGLTREYRGGPVFSSLTERIVALFEPYAEAAREAHLSEGRKRADRLIDLEAEARALGIDPTNWKPTDLARLLPRACDAGTIAAYGRAPVWVYGALAFCAAASPFLQFDVRQGWLAAPQIIHAGETLGLQVKSGLTRAGHLLVRLRIEGGYLDYEDPIHLPRPPISPDRGVIIEGKLPAWLYCGLVRAWRDARWVAIYYPQLDGQAVVIGSHDRMVLPGELVAVDLSDVSW
ncbi:MAG: CRISPR-associated protein Csx3 [Anaerolineae bacterium]